MIPAGEVELINHPALEYFGKTPEELKGWVAAEVVQAALTEVLVKAVA